RSNPFVKRLIQRTAFRGTDAVDHFNASRAQQLDSTAGMERIRIDCADDNASHLRLDQRIDAWRRSAACRTRLHRDVKRRVFRNWFAEIAQTFDLGMRSSRGAVMAASKDLSSAHEDSSDRRVGTR